MRSTFTIALILSLPALGHAQTLPKGTSSLSSSEISTMFSGKTYSFQEKGKNGKMTPIAWYLGEDGKMLGYTGNGPSYAEGTWSASDGKLCVKNRWVGSWGTSDSSDCQEWAHETAKTQATYRAETSKGGKFEKLSPKLASGDTISPKIAALKAKLKK
ncbi:DUF995 domain-containing protein [Rhizobium sp. NZLR3b]|uniref:DUF995 domain-containing protein n=1 Tax=Rhizobium sp. NZLR3b TaxID=2731101 RepID=UPI001C82F415|nr:DUF995 domain-containing protein [Rhizobium sp. NZLR3b]MBX5189338.1 DUF995 domain-containing protein [Rhizobium sp. NZLR3b]